MSNIGFEWEVELQARIDNVDRYKSMEQRNASLNYAGIQMMRQMADTEAAIKKYQSILGWFLPEEMQNATIRKFRQLREAQVKG